MIGSRLEHGRPGRRQRPDAPDAHAADRAGGRRGGRDRAGAAGRGGGRRRRRGGRPSRPGRRPGPRPQEPRPALRLLLAPDGLPAPAALPRLPRAHDVPAGPLPQPGRRAGRRPSPAASGPTCRPSPARSSRRGRRSTGPRGPRPASAWASRRCSACSSGWRSPARRCTRPRSASLREYAVLRALGIPRRRMAGLVMAQSLWVGLAGIALALPLIFALAAGGDDAGARVLLAPLAVRPGLGPDPGDGPVVRPGRPALAAPGRADHPACDEGRPRRCHPSRPWSPATWTAPSAPARRPCACSATSPWSCTRARCCC